MRKVITVVMVAAALVASTACKKDSTEKDGATKTAVKAGSHEDWCDEHAVPESQCTKCNPALIPAFKATGDWCEQHKLPKSHDRECNPKLQIQRPPKT